MNEIRILYEQLAVPQMEQLLNLATGSVREQTYIARFFALLGEHPKYDDDAMAAALYGAGKDHRYKPYQKLKHKFKYLLLNLFLVMEDMQPNYTSRENAVKSIFREYTAARLMAEKKNTVELAVRIYERVYKRAVEFEVTPVAFDTARDLMTLYGGTLKDEKKYFKYENQYHRLEELARVENYLNQIYTRIVIAYRKRKNEDLIGLIETHLHKIEDAVDNYDSVRVQYSGGLCLTAYYNLIGDADKLFQSAQTVYTALRKKRPKVVDPGYFRSFQVHMGHAYALKSDYNKAVEMLTLQLDSLKPSDYNFPYTSLLRVMYMMQTQDYRKARFFYEELSLTNFRKYASVETRELYLLLGGYLALVEEYQLRSGKEISNGGRDYRPFRVNKLKNQIVKISKRKERLNFYLQVLIWMFALIRGEHNKIISWQEGFDKYVRRYLSVKRNPRQVYFAKLLLLLPSTNFHAVRTFHHGQKLLQRMRAYEKPKGDYLSLATEVISYEKLWWMVLASLQGFEHLDAEFKVDSLRQ